MFEDLSFSLEGGSALVVTGANGIGKSSLLRTLAGLVPLAQGSIRLEGGAPDTPPQEHIHYFGHQDAVKPALSALENLQFWRNFCAAAHGSGFSGDPMEPLKAFDILGIEHTAQLPAAFLSAGQKRRLSLCRLLVTPRPVWLMDEPTAALDRVSESQLLDLMNAHLAAGGLIVTATHSDLALEKTLNLHLQTGDAADLPLEDAPQ